jgi:hypothetical protein
MTASTSPMFGWKTGSLDDRARQLEKDLRITLEPRDSLYWGEYYNWRGDGSSHLLLQENFIEEDDGLPTVSEHPDHAIILHTYDLPGGWIERIASLDGVERLEGDAEQ